VTKIAVRLGSLLPRLDELAFSLEPIALWPGTAVVDDRRELLSMIEDDLLESDAAATACIEPVDPRRAASSGEIVLIALNGILMAGLAGPPDKGLGVGSTVNPGGRRPRVIFLFFLFFCRSSSILFSQMDLLVKISSTANCIAGSMSVTASNSGRAKMFIKPICDSPSLTMSSRTGGPPKRHEGISNSSSMSPWLLNSSVRILAHLAAVSNFRACEGELDHKCSRGRTPDLPRCKCRRI